MKKINTIMKMKEEISQKDTKAKIKVTEHLNKQS